jgi:hypothetical protein
VSEGRVCSKHALCCSVRISRHDTLDEVLVLLKLKSRPASSLNTCLMSGRTSRGTLSFEIKTIISVRHRAGILVLDVHPSVFYDLLFSLASVANSSFTCGYHAVQTCSAWSMRLWQGVIIVLIYFCAVSLFTSALGLSLQLCYGYAWTCLPMVCVRVAGLHRVSKHPVPHARAARRAEEDRTHQACLTLCTPGENSSRACLSRYPTAQCTRSCKEALFEYVSASSVVAWVLAEIGPWATD